jgi:hypothetical protein
MSCKREGKDRTGLYVAIFILLWVSCVAAAKVDDIYKKVVHETLQVQCK